jgi:hypothetical protein
VTTLVRLPSRFGGIGLRSVAESTGAAFAGATLGNPLSASGGKTSRLTLTLAVVADIKAKLTSAGCHEALKDCGKVWEAAELLSTAQPVAVRLPHVQKILCAALDELKAHELFVGLSVEAKGRLLSTASSDGVRILLRNSGPLAARSPDGISPCPSNQPGLGPSLLSAVPTDCELRLADSEMRDVLAFRLGLDLVGGVASERCVCAKKCNVDVHHAVTCPSGGGPVRRHDHAGRVVLEAIAQVGGSVRVLPTDVLRPHRESGAAPPRDFIPDAVVKFKDARPIILDFVVAHNGCKAYRNTAGKWRGSASCHSEREKVRKYGPFLPSDHELVPLICD